MRPCSSSSVRMEGMLFSTLVLRRFDQKPSSIVTARTGTVWSFANGEFVRFSTPWSCHGRIGDAVAPVSAAADEDGVPSAKESAGLARKEAAVVVTAVERNRRRETSRSELITTSW